MTTEAEWKRWLGRLYSLRRDKRGSHERPHKPALLLAIIEQLDHGIVTENRFPLTEELISSFKKYFEIVRQPTDQPTIQNPFFHLAGDEFWHLKPKSGRDEIYRTGEASGSPSLGELRRRVAYGFFDEELWHLIAEHRNRTELREALVDRYFPGKREDLLTCAAQPARSDSESKLRENFQRGRDAAFRKTILEIYDYRCAACGIRVLLDSQISLVEAAHLIPFNVGRNDRPDNGVALCPNHHWAMDRLLIALSNRPVIPPSEKKFLPAVESLRWRQDTFSREC